MGALVDLMGHVVLVSNPSESYSFSSLLLRHPPKPQREGPDGFLWFLPMHALYFQCMTCTLQQTHSFKTLLDSLNTESFSQGGAWGVVLFVFPLGHLSPLWHVLSAYLLHLLYYIFFLFLRILKLSLFYSCVLSVLWSSVLVFPNFAFNYKVSFICVLFLPWFCLSTAFFS